MPDLTFVEKAPDLWHAFDQRQSFVGVVRRGPAGTWIAESTWHGRFSLTANAERARQLLSEWIRETEGA